uniref:Uncharacterized protein n=1 Tax=Anguilla anguilla TaxID=7936 RepID=A0A0E9XEA3_ANGAN
MVSEGGWMDLCSSLILDFFVYFFMQIQVCFMNGVSAFHNKGLYIHSS